MDTQASAPIERDPKKAIEISADWTDSRFLIEELTAKHKEAQKASKPSESGRCRALAITKLQEAHYWLTQAMIYDETP